MQSVFEEAGGDQGMLRLAHAWHELVLEDEVVSHAFSHGYQPDHTERLAAYWTEALGGPPKYSEAFGNESSVLEIHSGNGPHDEMDRRAIACFDQALTDVGIGSDGAVRQVLKDYFLWATTASIFRYESSLDEVPSGLKIPHWSWNGLVDSQESDSN
ncbi:MAG: oxidoreductase [Acidimicrobiaceae bacterium]|nr:oxidoreductase [Acidimicrobiaceae bacterium]